MSAWHWTRSLASSPPSPGRISICNFMLFSFRSIEKGLDSFWYSKRFYAHSQLKSLAMNRGDGGTRVGLARLALYKGGPQLLKTYESTSPLQGPSQGGT